MHSVYSTAPADWASGDKEVDTFPNDNVKVIVQQEFKFVYFDVTAQRVGHYATETSPCWNSGSHLVFQLCDTKSTPC